LITAKRIDALRLPGALAGALGDDGVYPGLNAIDRSLAGAGLARRNRYQQNEDGTKSRGYRHGLPSICVRRRTQLYHQIPGSSWCLSQTNVSASQEAVRACVETRPNKRAN
jgi:hypothetical protein